MHPINKKAFGPGAGKMSIDFHNGTAVVTGYIVRQTGSKRFVVTADGVNKFVVTLAPTLAIATALTAGYGTLKVTPASGPVEHVKTIHAHKVVTHQGHTYRWTLGNAVAADMAAVAAVVVPLSITGTPAAGKVGTAYTFTPTVSGGTGTKAFTASGTLPAGLTLNGTTGVVSGTPTAAGTSAVTITVTDGSGSASLTNASFVVNA